MSRAVVPEGAARLVLASGVVHLAPEAAVFQAMLEGWSRQQASRLLKPDTIADRLRLLRRFAAFTGEYPWQWTPAEVEAFTTELRSGPRQLAFSTIRSYQLGLRLFGEYLTDPRYGWVAECERRFGAVPSQVCHEWNTVDHMTDYEGQPGRRALTYDEVQALFDAADARAEAASRSGRKGALQGLRDAALLKVVYAFGLRRREAAMLDLADFRRNPRVPAFGRFGSVQVRWGKSSRGGPPKRRTVLTVPEMDWITIVLEHWIEQVRPRFAPGACAAVWVTERRGRVSVRWLDEVFAELRAPAGLEESADLHSLRHSYVTHLLEFGYPELFVQHQAGHLYAATTALYSSVGDEFRNRLLHASLERQLPPGGQP